MNRWTITTSSILPLLLSITGCATSGTSSKPLANPAPHVCEPVPPYADVIKDIRTNGEWLVEGEVGLYIFHDGVLWLTPEDPLELLEPKCKPSI